MFLAMYRVALVRLSVYAGNHLPVGIGIKDSERERMCAHLVLRR